MQLKMRLSQNKNSIFYYLADDMLTGISGRMIA